MKIFINFSTFSYFLMLNILFLSSNSFIWMWTIMELMNFSFIFLNIMFKNKWYLSIYYFIIQSISSIFLILSLSLMNFLNLEINFMLKFLFNISLILKMGIFPFHKWYINLSYKLNWNLLFILFTLMKIIPMNLIYLFPINSIINFSIFFSTLISSLLMLKSSNFKPFLTNSSINNTSWMIILINLNMNFWIMYFLIYSLINFYIINILNLTKIFSFKSLFMKKINYKIKFNLSLMILSILGMPPLSSFLYKFMHTLMISQFNLMIINYWIMILSIINIFSYLNLINYNLMFSIVNFNYFNLKLKTLKIKMNFMLFMLLSLIFLFSINY